MQATKERIRIGISSCLLGEKVRYNGDHKEDRFITGTLSQFFEWVPVCPEVEIGLGTPRETIRLVGDVDAPRLMTSNTNVDLTAKMTHYAKSKVRELDGLDLDGYILKKNSPSCGMERVRVYNDSGMPTRKGVGLFARVLLNSSPYLPVEEEGRLNDLPIRENFIVRVFCHRRWKDLTKDGFRLRDLVDFHTRHKLLVMAHNDKNMRTLGKLVAGAKSITRKQLKESYAALFFDALRHRSTARKNTNVLQHMQGHFKKLLEPADKQELASVIEDYRQGLLPLIVPLTLIKHYVNKFDIAYIKDQIYLNPHPKELMLRNHV
ncbi:DUF523 and DUF1722 domain-containing protein [bacterium]|nr:DUF523 and DUF1722 domain-containing protein [bacterium]